MTEDKKVDCQYFDKEAKVEHTLDEWAYGSCSYKKLKELSEKMPKEKWSFGKTETFDILKNYLNYTFKHLAYEEKIKYSTKGKDEYAVFNTGLVDKRFIPLYAVFTKNTYTPESTPKPKTKIPYWYCSGFYPKDEKELSFCNKKYPEKADYVGGDIHNVYFNARELLNDWDKLEYLNREHILSDNIDRLPKAYLKEIMKKYDIEVSGTEYSDEVYEGLKEKYDKLFVEYNKTCIDYNETKNDNKEREKDELWKKLKECKESLKQYETDTRKPYYDKLKRAIDQNEDCSSEMSDRLDAVLKLALKRVDWNYKTAVPVAFFPGGKTVTDHSFVLPLTLEKYSKVDTALVVQYNKERGSYVAHTIYTLETAYNNSRLIVKPEVDWLRMDEKNKDESKDESITDSK